MGRQGTGRFRTAKMMLNAWEEYKSYCDSRTVLVHEFSAKNSEFVSKELKRSITYTLKGFAVWCGMTEQNFYATYKDNSKFELVIARMKEECEVDARSKFELGIIDSRLAGLWMSHYGYTTKSDTSVAGSDGGPLVIRWMKSPTELSGKTDE